MVIEKFGIPAASSIGGWLGRAMTLAKKLETLEKSTEAMNKQVMEDMAECNRRCEELEKRFATSLATIMSRTEIERGIRELRQELRKMESRFRTTTGEFAKDAELSRFMTEEGDRWQKIERTMGQIEGTLRALGHIPR